jgi:hypothetical protein
VRWTELYHFCDRLIRSTFITLRVSLYVYEHTDQIDGIRARLYIVSRYQVMKRINIPTESILHFLLLLRKERGKHFIFFFLLKRFALNVVNRIGLSFSNRSEKVKRIYIKKYERNSNSCCCCIYKYCCGFPLLSSVEEEDDAKKKWKLLWFILVYILFLYTCTVYTCSRVPSRIFP